VRLQESVLDRAGGRPSRLGLDGADDRLVLFWGAWDIPARMPDINEVATAHLFLAPVSLILFFVLREEQMSRESSSSQPITGGAGCVPSEEKGGTHPFPHLLSPPMPAST